jgi:hypothetical protein
MKLLEFDRFVTAPLQGTACNIRRICTLWFPNSVSTEEIYNMKLLNPM